jgi:hypothetical protein
VRVSPATTAGMVANATAEIKASWTDPPTVPSPPPTACASSGDSAFPAEGLDLAALACRDQRSGTEAEHQRHQVERTDQADCPEHRLACRQGGWCGVEANGMYGRPAVPSTSAKPRDKKSNLPTRSLP